ncbi:hypothetical protein [Actinomadura sp. 7K507]|uniref:hypothetical protein n=1 Tax=Actinomadura sp. 7K507 TaxID=2530365 RepID=UPI0010512F8D|nr:hypothetical protein [Actinomadura sp. 7K507]TDC89687.1 hypothetical protein E1285_16105 [Actinomadura sp. 7K507]
MDDDPAKEQALSTNAQSTDAQSANTQLTNAQPADTQPTNSRSANAEPVNAGPADARFTGARPPDDLSGNARAAPESPAGNPEAGARRRLAALGAVLMVFTALPAAVLVVPDAAFNVVPAAASALGLGGGEIAVLLHATGLSLPALVVTAPLAAVVARRLPAWAVLVTGLAVLLAGLVAAGFAHSVSAVAAVRAAQGVGAGIVLPASLVLVWERGSRVLAAVWAGLLAGTLILAMPFALSAVPIPAEGTAAPDWRAALTPFPWPAAAAAVAAFAFPLLRGRRPWALPAARHAERGRLLLSFVPAAGFAFLAVVAAHDWSPGARLIVAGAALPTLAGLALAGDRDAAAGSPFGCSIVMIAVGLLCHPVAAPLAGLASAAAHVREGAGPPLLPFAVAAVAALAGALASTRAAARSAVPAGSCLMTAGVLLGLAAAPHDRWTLLLPLVPLGAGAGLALAASLRDAGVGAALFGLSLCFPALLTGQLLVLSLQASWLERLRPATGPQQAGALLDAYQVWLVVAAVAAALLASATARVRAR